MTTYKLGPAPEKELAEMTDQELLHAITYGIIGIDTMYTMVPPELFARLRDRFMALAGLS